jgi:hypothetical protein
MNSDEIKLLDLVTAQTSVIEHQTAIIGQQAGGYMGWAADYVYLYQQLLLACGGKLPAGFRLPSDGKPILIDQQPTKDLPVNVTPLKVASAEPEAAPGDQTKANTDTAAAMMAARGIVSADLKAVAVDNIANP